jgi:hypothetical protein
VVETAAAAAAVAAVARLAWQNELLQDRGGVEE